MKRLNWLIGAIALAGLAGCSVVNDFLPSKFSRGGTTEAVDHSDINAPAGVEGQVIDIGTLPPLEGRFSIAGLKIRTSVDEASDELILGGFRYDGHMWRKGTERLIFTANPNGLEQIQLESAIHGSAEDALTEACAAHGAVIHGKRCRTTSGDVEFCAWIDKTGPAPRLRRQLQIIGPERAPDATRGRGLSNLG